MASTRGALRGADGRDRVDRSGRSGTQAIERAIAVLWTVSGSSDGLGLTEVARRCGLRLSTTHRIAGALVEGGLLGRGADERYHLGVGVHELGLRAAEQLGYRDASRVLDRLSEVTDESVSLGVRREHHVQVMLVSSSTQRLRYDHELGGEIPLHASAMGKVLLAFEDDPRREVATLPRLARFTSATVTSKRELVRELEVVRSTGYATNAEERHRGVVGVAAPVFDTAGRVVAAIGVQGPSPRFGPDQIARTAGAVLQTAERLSGSDLAPARP